jgi:hypothetical protein
MLHLNQLWSQKAECIAPAARLQRLIVEGSQLSTLEIQLARTKEREDHGAT